MVAVPGPRVGVLALQGAAHLHLRAFADLGAEGREVRRPPDLAGIDALVIPGGESTTISMLLRSSGLAAPVAELVGDGLPVFGTCAGMIVLARAALDGRPDQLQLGAIDLVVRRNAFGRQRQSFEADLDVAALADAGLGADRFPAVFIRAPVIEEAGPEVEVLAHVDGRPVLARQGPVLVAAFHPELSSDRRLHRLFLASLTPTEAT